MNIVLVDDEKGIVAGLKKMIGRHIPECEVIDVAYNGMEGYELIHRLRPDIAITDIRMPQSDGLDMIKRLIDAGSPTKFILLSGYADFEYARQAMQLGVRFYINKPVEEEELRDCVRQVLASIRADRDKLLEVDALKQEVHNRNQESALRDIFEIGADHGELAEELLRLAGLPADHSRFVCVLMEFDGSVERVKETGLEPVYRHIEQALAKYKGLYRFRYSGAQFAVLAAHDQDIGYDDLVGSVRQLKEALGRELKLNFAAGIGTVHRRASGISESFEEARHALGYKVIKGTDAVIPYPDIRMDEKRLPIGAERMAELEAGIENLDEAGCADVIRGIFSEMETAPGMSPADLRLQCVNILLSSARTMSVEQLRQSDFLGRHLLSLEAVSKFKTIACFEEWTVQAIGALIAFKREHQMPKKKDLIAEIKAYVTENFDQPISLADLSSRFYISPIYLSQIFKQKTGETYVSFLAKVRIGKAKELLERTDLKVYEICQRVGYSDTQYFARLFEKWTGLKPTEYRKRQPNM
ncbi:response regulator [Cohnella hashimotonis]|uniref:Response regulator n=1 Tax=Cohnella hashimotonis TaxID=2826895 RepID=A0ABT6T9R5_9BACL|nr:response regulator [Cohnella hashimotonis]